jgi:SecD/SecF fusion protein
LRERRNYLILVGLIAAALVGVTAMAIPGSPIHQKPNLGLDLQGGLEVVLKAVPPKGRPLSQSDLDRSISIMRNRVDKLGVSEPEIRKQGKDQIVIELPGIKDPEAAAALIGKTARLELYDLETSVTGPSRDVNGQPQATNSLYQLLTSVQSNPGKNPAGWYVFDAKKRVRAGPLRNKADAFDTKVISKQGGKLPKGWKLFAVPEGTVVISCGPQAGFCPGVNTPNVTRTYYYLFTNNLDNPNAPEQVPQLTGEDLKLSGTRQDFDPTTGRPEVLMQFTKEGGNKFQQVTGEEWTRGKLLNAPQHFAIVLDREIRSFPQIDYTDSSLAGGISGGSARITGDFTVKEAKDLALVLQTGALPVEFVTQSETEVSATLGADSLREAEIAAAVGLLVVALFLLVFYRFLGVVAVIGLGIYVALLYAAILLFNVTLTLPGFAGMILTIGVAADANIVIFERIKEEFRAGKSVRSAIAAGYAKGFHTIIDANVVTAITALVLFAVATASVKGFALMLLIGTGISLLTAVAATRAMLGLLGGFAWFDNPRFMGAQAQQRGKWMEIDFMKRRYLWFAISGVVILISVVSLGIRGLNLGIDFEGGSQIAFSTPQPEKLSEVRAAAGTIGEASAQVQGLGKDYGGFSYKDFQIRTKTLPTAEQNRLTNTLERDFSQGRELAIQTNTVSASFGRQIARGALLAIAFSLFLIVLYITFRFQFKFALPVIAALLHDLVITIGIYSLIGAEVSTATVAAVLTVLGYSIYDTIIIFDRIRENIPLMRRASFATIANVSLWEVMRRSLATTFITLLPVASLYLFGGATLKDFAFALLIGIGSGAYSSIFIAAPLLTVWKEREPEFARRKDHELTEAEAEAALEESEEALAEEPAAAPELVPVAGAERQSAAAKRERRRQRRRARPHGRSR